MVEIHSLSIGTILKSKGRQYRIEKVLGHGAFGITYLAMTVSHNEEKECQLPEKVAIKEFFMKDYCSRDNTGCLTEAPSGSIIEKYREGFKKEAKNQAKLCHPNIVKVFEVISTNNTCYIVMEYIKGTTLDKYIPKDKGLNEHEALSIARDIAEAMKYMHGRKMLHLDLKPKNVMRDNDGRIYVIDFGLSKQYDNYGEPESSTAIGNGTQGYAPLEQLSPVDGNSFPVTIDIYALGATLYKMLSGKTPPYASEVLNNKDVVESELKKYNISHDVIQLVRDSMCPIKEKRIQSMDVFVEAINCILKEDSDEETVVETDEKKFSADGNQDERKSRNKLKISTFVLFVFVVIGMFLYFGNRLKYSSTPIVEEASVAHESHTSSRVPENSHHTQRPSKTTTNTPPKSNYSYEEALRDSIEAARRYEEESEGVKKLSFGIWTGGLKNGVPNGTGQLDFTKDVVIDTDVTANAGDVFKGRFSDGQIDSGKIYKTNGEVVTIIGVN